MKKFNFPFINEFELIKKYRFKSIFWVYFRYLFLITFIPIMTIAVLITVYYASSSLSNFRDTTYDKFRIAATNIETAFNEADNIHFQLSSSDDILNYSISGYSTEVREHIDSANNIYEDILNYVNFGHYIKEIHVYFPGQGYVFSNTESNKYEKHSRKHLFSPVNDENLYKYFIHEPEKMLLHFATPITHSKYITAIVVYDINMSEILMSAGENTDIYITERDTNRIMYSTKANEGEILEGGILKNSLASFNKLVNSGSSSAMSIPIYNAQYNFTCVAKNSLSKGFKATMWMIILAMLFVTLFLPLLIALYFSSRFYRSITELTSAFNDAGGDTTANANELNFLTSSIFTTLEKNKAIENQLTASAKNLKLLQSQALQMQISPHFIFNTLNLANVIVMRELKRSNDAETVISHLATLISAVLDNTNTVITVSEEMSYIDEFIEIERIRFKNKFDVIYEIDANVYNRNIIKFTLQPIIENCFEYGIKPMKDTQGKIKIKAYNEGDDTVFKITDNGEGFSPETLRKINWAMASDSPTPPDSHIGLYNVNKRIKLMCGSMYGIHITSVPGETCVTIRFCLS